MRKLTVAQPAEKAGPPDAASECAEGISGMNQLVQAVYERRNSPQDRAEAIEKLLSTMSVISDLDDDTRSFHNPPNPNKEWCMEAKGEWESYF